MSKSEAIEKLMEIGAKIEKREDSYGVTRSGWWIDGVWLAPANKPKDALQAAFS